MREAYSRVGTVSRNGDEADVAMLIAARVVVSSNDGQTGVLSLSSRVGLERTSGETSHGGKVLGEFLYVKEEVSEEPKADENASSDVRPSSRRNLELDR